MARAKDYAYANDVSIFVSCHSDIEVLEKALKRYEVMDFMINNN